MATLNIEFYDTYSISLELEKCDLTNSYKLRISKNDTTERKSNSNYVECFLPEEKLAGISSFIMEQISNDK